MYFSSILFNNHCQTHSNDNKKFNKLVHPAIFSGIFDIQAKVVMNYK